MREKDKIIEELQKRVRELEEAVFWRSTLFYKAFGVTGFMGDFVEFGVFKGYTLSQAYWSAYRHYELFAGGHWGHASSGNDRRQGHLDAWSRMRFIGFDSFEGIPVPTGPDAERMVFAAGTYSAPMDDAINLLKSHNVNLDKVKLIKGFFEDVCTPQTAADHKIEKIAVAHIDSDLYSSAVTALDFCRPYFQDGSVVIFDEWFQFGGSPEFGEQRAFREWLDKNSQWRAAELAREGNGRIAFILTKRT